MSWHKAVRQISFVAMVACWIPLPDRQGYPPKMLLLLLLQKAKSFEIQPEHPRNSNLCGWSKTDFRTLDEFCLRH
jgi:hypothetical protein